MNIDGDQVLDDAIVSLGIDLAALIAATSLWARPEVVRRVQKLDQFAAWYPNTRRYRPGERVGDIKDGIRLDNNSYANIAAKQAILGGRTAVRFTVCHIWPTTCYDARYHTSIANLILVPSAVAGLTDHDRRVCDVIRYRAFDLYGWRPSEEVVPTKPIAYPSFWRDFPDTASRVHACVDRLEKKPGPRLSAP